MQDIHTGGVNPRDQLDFGRIQPLDLPFLRGANAQEFGQVQLNPFQPIAAPVIPQGDRSQSMFTPMELGGQQQPGPLTPGNPHAPQGPVEPEEEFERMTFRLGDLNRNILAFAGDKKRDARRIAKDYGLDAEFTIDDLHRVRDEMAADNKGLSERSVGAFESAVLLMEQMADEDERRNTPPPMLPAPVIGSPVNVSGGVVLGG